jgi:hypothetical protein
MANMKASRGFYPVVPELPKQPRVPNVLRATTACTFSTSQLPKVVRAWCVLYILTSKCASRHNGVHFFDISTSKSGPTMVCFVHFDLEMCFAPQRRALFAHLNFQRCSGPEAFCTFSHFLLVDHVDFYQHFFVG